MTLSIGHYLSNMSKLTDQWNRHNYKEPGRQRIYLKDIDCPQIWHDKLQGQIPPSVFYLNESIGDHGGPGATEQRSQVGLGNTKGQGLARAGDLMSSLPPAMRAENMMCYIGHEGTYTPAHREMCASLGQNLLVEASGRKGSDGKPTKPGSSIWFMTETNDRHTVSEYWLSTLGHDIEVESHFAQINAWKAAPFKTYIVDQRAGDFVLIPPLAPHQVWNRGTRTMKVAWNRTTVETLEMALHEALPRARMVCRDEQYKNKAIVYYSLVKYSGLLKKVDFRKQSAPSRESRMEIEYNPKTRQLQKDFKRLFSLFKGILLSEMFSPVATSEKRGQYLPYDSFITCSYCRCNIFNRFLTCTTCIVNLQNGEEDTYDICMDCFAMGRSCHCLSKYKWVEQFPWQELVQKYETWRHQIINLENGLNDILPQPLEIERKKIGKKTLAQVCQEQLKIRPWNDVNNPSAVKIYQGKVTGRDEGEVGVEVDDDGNVKKSKSKKSRADKMGKEFAIEHVSSHPEHRWKLAFCSKCDRCYTFGSLFRMFDLMPLTVMEKFEWECPHCLKICSAAKCRNINGMKPYEPSGTVLGHDTRKVADPRSVETLVDFAKPNVEWIKKAGDDHPQDNRRMSRRRDEAEKVKARDPVLNENYVDEAHPHLNDQSQSLNPGITYTASEIPIDPMLSMDQSMAQTNGHSRDRVAHSGYGGSSTRGLFRPRERSSSLSSSDNENVRPSSDLHKVGRDVSSLEPRQQHHMAPFANIMEQNIPFTNNGIAYEYPDPTMSQRAPANELSHYNRPENPPNMGPTSSILQNDSAAAPAPPHPQDGGQELSHLTQLERMLEGAKLNDRYILTEAQFTGKSLRVKLFVSKAKLETVRASSHSQRLGQLDGVQPIRKEPPILLQSDLPSLTHTVQPTVVNKKRKIREENDSDFSTRKRPNRKSSTANSALAKSTRQKPVNYAEPSSDSEAAQKDTSSFVPVKKPHRPRPLPKYLAQRTEGDDAAQLAELPGSRTSTQPKKHSPPPGTANDQSPDNDFTGAGHQHSPANPYLSTSPRAEGLRSPNRIPRSTEILRPPPDKDLAMTDPKSPHPASVESLRKLAEDNRKAKLKALLWESDKDDDDEDEFESSDPDTSSSQEDSIPAQPSGRLLPAPKSIFSTGRNVKIVAAKVAPVNPAPSPKGRGRPRHSLNAASERLDVQFPRGRGRPRESLGAA